MKKCPIPQKVTEISDEKVPDPTTSEEILQKGRFTSQPRVQPAQPSQPEVHFERKTIEISYTKTTEINDEFQ